MVDEVALITGIDIPFIPAEITIHQPTIEEIAYIGEASFFIGIHFLNFSRDMLNVYDLEKVKGISDFNLFLGLLNQDNPTSQFNKNCVQMVLMLMFPEADKVLIMPNMVAIVQEGQNHIINGDNYTDFKQVVAEIFAMEGFDKGQRDYNPANTRAQKLADQLRRGREKAKKLKQMNDTEGQSDSIISRYISILAVGEQKDINLFKKYTVYQLFDEFNRYSYKLSFDQNMSFRLAGAQDLEQPKDWMANMHSSPQDIV